ncbi:cysteine desulfurase family protein [Aquirufa rosea]|uniref:cysteine desulfurase n=1 Tax=Aquirufa rosea TaxID=2509241 RepID=A0A4Q1BXP6_9BACT|nr:cysteine desulfurase family protein [Aquirufa rosea]RXK47117.1 cysteine desulfurase [Aquirufa rosea]
MSNSVTPIYLDNAATTPIDPVVWQEMQPYFENFTANPSSIHSHGRQAKVAIEKARKTIATLLNASPSEIFFTSGGTEADNTVIQSAVLHDGVKTIITSPLEHHAVLHTAEAWHKLGLVDLKLVQILPDGSIDLADLERLLQENPSALVSLMHGNNEIGNLLDLEAAGALCEKYGAVFHSDTVQTMGHYRHDMSKLPVHFIVGAAHKFHGPKGIGFLYAKSGSRFHPLLHGGAQERNQRGGTENVYGAVGIAKALSIAYEEMDAHEAYIKGLKSYFIEGLKKAFPNVEFNGKSGDVENSLYTVLNVRFPQVADGDMLLFQLDIEKISASGGSACSSGTSVGSHVLSALNPQATGAAIRFSFSKNNTQSEIDRVLEVLKKLIPAA